MSFAAAGQSFVLNQQLMSIGGDLWIDDANGNHAFLVDGKALAIRRTLVLQNLNGQPLYQINQSLAHVRKTFEVKVGDQVVCTIEKALVSFLGDRFKITATNGDQLAVTGDCISREFHVTNGGQEVILASRKLMSLHGGYGVQVAPGFDVPLALAIVIALEQMELQEGHR